MLQDVDTIYLSQNCKELNLKDFDLPDPRFVCLFLFLSLTLVIG